MSYDRRSRQPVRRFFLADPRSATPAGRARLTRIAAILADPPAAARWYQDLAVRSLDWLAADYDGLSRLLSADPPGGAGAGSPRDVRELLDRHGVSQLPADERQASAETAWDALYAAEHDVPGAAGELELATRVLRVCRLAELFDAVAGCGELPTWPDLADVIVARPMVPPEIYRVRHARVLAPTPAVTAGQRGGTAADGPSDAGAVPGGG
ncbi:MAG: hypothetical protein IRZ08_11575, partial [Frankia sp.]|nr:hypothetical protein [Frankia sp.]